MYASDARRPDARATSAIVATFVAAIALPGVVMLARPAKAPAGVRVEATAAPPTFELTLSSLAAFPVKFHRWFNDNFGLRDELIRAYSAVKLHGLGVSPSSMVMIGRDGWLFYRAEGEDACMRRARPFPPTALADWVRVVKERNDWLAARGIPYVFVVAPDAHTIYPEYLPESVRPAAAPSRFDQLTDALRAVGVHVVDVRPALLAAKRDSDVYLRLDTHWNEMGAYVAYREITAAIAASRPVLRPTPLADFDVGRVTREGDLSRIFGLPGEFHESVPVLVPKAERRARMTLGGEGPLSELRPGIIDWVATERADAEIGKLVMFRDSFSSALMPFLSEHFGRAVYRWTWGFEQDLVEHEQPDIVVEEIVERALMRDHPVDDWRAAEER